MNLKMRNIYSILNTITNSEWYKLIYVLSLILAIYGGLVLSINSDDFISAVLKVFQFPIFNLLLFSLFFLNTLHVSVSFNRDFSFYIIRLGSRKKYVRKLLQLVTLMNLFHLLIFFLLFLLFLNLNYFGKINIELYQNYSISNLTYMLFFLTRYILILLLVCTFSSLIFTVVGKSSSLIYNGIILLGFMPQSMYVKRTKFVWEAFFPWYYLTAELTYRSFVTELIHSSIFVLSIAIFTYILYSITIRNNKWRIA